MGAQSQVFVQKKEVRTDSDASFYVASLVLNNAKQANALSGSMLRDIQKELATLAQDPSIRVLLVRGAGKHFCAGADLNWMKKSASLGHAENLAEADELAKMFQLISSMPFPTVAVVRGAVYGGGVGLVAACDYAMADSTARFCLSEVKIGLIPAVILPYLKQKLRAGDLTRLALTARIFSAADAASYGLVQNVANEGDLDKTCLDELNLLLQASPEAQKAFKTLQKKLAWQHSNTQELTSSAIANIRASEEGKHGLERFFNKEQPEWVCSLEKLGTLFEDR
ncbi:MAG: enoyl-CoA hydratase-related protein [Oligoflexales bacterium]